MKLFVHVQGIQDVRNSINSIMKGLEDLRPPMKEVSVMLQRWVDKKFESSGGNVGGWKELKLKGRWKYKEKKGKDGKVRKVRTTFDPSAKVLLDTRNLQKSFKPFYSYLDAGVGTE